MGINDLVRQAAGLLDAGTLTKHDEAFVSTVVTKFDRGNNLDSSEVLRLREILDRNL